MNGWARIRLDRQQAQSRTLEWLAAACLGGALAFSSWMFAATLPEAARSGVSAAAGLAGFALALRFLDRFGVHPHARPAANGQSLEPSALLLRLQDVLAEASAADLGAGELLLDDPLPVAEPGSRVVQLFQPPVLPTAGELRARIDRHLDNRSNSDAPADHSDELFEALASLKRSLG